MTDAINRQLVSDVSVCTFLSGGLDSSIISKVASDYMAQRGEILDTYSVDYSDNDRYFEPSLFQPNKDSDYINLISDYIDSDHHNVVLNNIAVADALIDSTEARGCPGFTDIDSSLLLFCKEVVKITRLRSAASVQMKFSAVIRGITGRKYYLRRRSHGAEVPM